jgi:pyruvate dehydrogenase E1 component beta subunit
MREITYREAVKEALSEEIERDENVVLIGEESPSTQRAYKVTEGLWKKYGDKRASMPRSASGFVGMGSARRCRHPALPGNYVLELRPSRVGIR